MNAEKPPIDDSVSQSNGPVVVVDALGLLCPLPIVHTARRLKEVSPGAIVEILSDDPGIFRDLPAWCDAMGHELLSLVEQERVWRGRVRKGTGGTSAA